MDTLQLGLEALERKDAAEPVECLGQVFESDQARREHYLALLAERLKDPRFRKTSGFPKGPDKAILRMSDPPYFTACPNPFLGEFVRHHGQPHDPDEGYHRNPFAVDVSEGKTDSLYRAHSYHTKVPHLAIVPSILHYTKPGDIVLDGFCGSGMTGVAAQWCGRAPSDYRQRLEANWKRAGREKPQWGFRRVVLADLSPAATFIAANYNIPFNVDAFAKSTRAILDEVNEEVGWMYETLHTDGKTKGVINYTIWSEIFTCRECSNDVIFFNQAVDKDTGNISKSVTCPYCGTVNTKEQMDLRFETYVDQFDGFITRRPKRLPVKINYSIDGERYEKDPDRWDHDVIERIKEMTAPTGLPVIALPDCQMTRVGRMRTTNTQAVHHMFLPRPMHGLLSLWNKAQAITDVRLRNMLLFFFEQAISGLSVLNRFGPSHYSQVNKALNGVYYVSSLIAEVSPKYNLELRLRRLRNKAFRAPISAHEMACISTGDCARLDLDSESVDYIFTDPPFGENIYYADLNFLCESWHQVFTSPDNEAIIDRVRKKGIPEYQNLITRCISEYYRVLKPGHWMTVVFSNSKNAIWRSIQEAIGVAGFVVADVRTLDKQQGSFRQATSSAVKQDLVISAYKPTKKLEARFALGSATIDDVWHFVQEHLGNVPIFVSNANDEADIIGERSPQMLHDRMIAFFVQRGVAVPISSPDFFMGVDQRYPQRDGMYFLPSQIAEYDHRRITVSELRQMDLFVQDEASAIQWIRQQLQVKPQTFQDLQPQFMQQIQAWFKHEKTVELKEILDLNFLRYDGTGSVPSQIHSYLSTNLKLPPKRDWDESFLKEKAVDRWYVPDSRKEGDLERLRTRAMLREFEEYCSTTKSRIRRFRTEAIRVGFKHCYEKQDYQTIVAVARRLPEQVVQEDEKLLMYYDVAAMRLGEVE